ncbi:MAG: radical SAM protein [bacterium]
MIAFGPVPSRRLGRSLGINNIPPKVCTYSCIYCQVGRTREMRVERQPYYRPDRILREVEAKIAKAREAGEPIDYLTFVPDGEPTLDLLLGREIELLRPLGIKIAVITNASLCFRPDVSEALSQADWVSLKVDSAREAVWRKTNRPHRRLLLAAVLEGMVEFARGYRGELTTETMLVGGVNDGQRDAAEVAAFLASLRPARAYLAVPTRPPAEKGVSPPGPDVLNRYYQTLSAHLDAVELLVGYEGNAFAFTGCVAEDILSITAVHPMREDAVRDFLARGNADWSVIRDLVDEGRLVETRYDGHRFYLRRARTASRAAT